MCIGKYETGAVQNKFMNIPRCLGHCRGYYLSAMFLYHKQSYFILQFSNLILSYLVQCSKKCSDDCIRPHLQLSLSDTLLEVEGTTAKSQTSMQYLGTSTTNIRTNIIFRRLLVYHAILFALFWYYFGDSLVHILLHLVKDH